MVILIVVVGILYMRVQISDVATVIFGFIAAILLMINEVGFSPVSTPRQFNDKDTINAVLDYTLRDSLLFHRSDILPLIPCTTSALF